MRSRPARGSPGSRRSPGQLPAYSGSSAFDRRARCRGLAGLWPAASNQHRRADSTQDAVGVLGRLVSEGSSSGSCGRRGPQAIGRRAQGVGAVRVTPAWCSGTSGQHRRVAHLVAHAGLGARFGAGSSGLCQISIPGRRARPKIDASRPPRHCWRRPAETVGQWNSSGGSGRASR